MTEAEWLAGQEPERMLDRVADRLSDRQLHLLACGLVRRIWEILPAGTARAALEFCERHAGEAHCHADADSWLEQLAAAAEPGRDQARAAQRLIVLSADPDADPDTFQHDTGRGAYPPAPLFQAACRAAAASVEQAAEAAGHAIEVVATLLGDPPGEEQIAAVRVMVRDTAIVHANANLDASLALKLKSLGDAAADADPRKNVNVRYAAALQTVTKDEEAQTARRAEVEEQKERADRRATARLLHEVAGNPFRPFRFEPAWRTPQVAGLAQAIDEHRAFERMTQLADALLDADCDEEAVLRHCRGTEPHAAEGTAHARGCWVIEQVLAREQAYFAQPPLVPPPPPPPSAAPKKSAPDLNGMARLLKALQQADDDED